MSVDEEPEPPPAEERRATRGIVREEDRKLDEALELTFPASDPVALCPDE